jgi:hypothetical protein
MASRDRQPAGDENDPAGEVQVIGLPEQRSGDRDGSGGTTSAVAGGA